MEGKLHKDHDNYYYLTVNDKIFASIDGHPLKSITNKLSLKNCQAIESGYDLDELAENFANDKFHVGRWSRNDSVADENYGCKIGYIEGFQKALELIGDKKFSEENVLKVVTSVLNELVMIDGFDKKYLFPESIYQETTAKCKSLQQTEWDVEVVTEIISDEGFPVYHKPKLDANGCLILKRK